MDFGVRGSPLLPQISPVCRRANKVWAPNLLPSDIFSGIDEIDESTLFTYRIIMNAKLSNSILYFEHKI